MKNTGNMKFSKYNILLPFEEKYIYYNCLSNIFISVDPVIAKILDSLKENSKNPIELKQIHESFYKALINNNFIVDEIVDEHEAVNKLICKTNANKDHYRLIINPTLDCNFNCWYCYENHQKGSKMTQEIVRRVKLLINNICSDTLLKTFQLTFFGGEPLLYFNEVVVPITEYAKDIALTKKKNFFADMTTNGYLLNEKMIKKMTMIGFENFQITFDGNKENHDKTRFTANNEGSFDVIVKNIKMLWANGLNIIMRINYTNENLNGIDSLLYEFDDIPTEDKKKITISMNKVWQNTSVDIEKTISLFTERACSLGFDFFDSLLSNRVKHSCYADKENEVVINYDGFVYKCNARDFTNENKEGFLDEYGNIVWNEQYKKRLLARLTNMPCKSCFIYPICGGGCTQRALDNYNTDYCVNDFDNEKKKQLIINMLSSKFLKLINNEK
jgi:uncharacterized protein